VLVDLPDVDSRYSDHLDLTRRLLRHMLFPIWIQSVEKYADQQPQKLLAEVAQGNDPSNFVFVLNKCDQLPLHEAKSLKVDYSERIARLLKLPRRPNLFMVSAIQPDQFELPALKQILAQEKSWDDVTHAIDLARRQRQRSILSWVREQELDQRVHRLQRLQDDAQELTTSRLGEPLIDEVIPRILDDPGYRLTLIEDVMNQRIARWPGVNLVHTLLAPLGSLYRISAAPAASSVSSLVEHHIAHSDLPLSPAIQSTFSTLHQTHPEVAELYRARKLWEDPAADAAATELRISLASVLTRQRQRAMEKLTGRLALLAPWRWLLTIGALLWFPFIQPILQVLLADGIIAMNRQALVLVVKIFSAAYLLQAAGFLLIWFIFLWSYLRWDTSRRVNRLLGKLRRASETTPGDSTNLATAALAWIDGLLDPIRQSRQRLEQLAERAHQLESNVAAAA
jgi:hypothetical protein